MADDLEVHESEPEDLSRFFRTQKEFLAELEQIQSEGNTSLKIPIPNFRSKAVMEISIDDLRESEKIATKLVHNPNFEGYVPAQVRGWLFMMRGGKGFTGKRELLFEWGKIQKMIDEGIPPYREKTLYGKYAPLHDGAWLAQFPTDDFLVEFGSGKYFENRQVRSKQYQRGNIPRSMITPASAQDVRLFCQRCLRGNAIDPHVLVHAKHTAETYFQYGGTAEEAAAKAAFVAQDLNRFAIRMGSALAPLAPTERRYKDFSAESFDVEQFYSEIQVNPWWYLDYSMEDREQIVKACHDQLFQRVNTLHTSMFDAVSSACRIIHPHFPTSEELVTKIMKHRISALLDTNDWKIIPERGFSHPVAKEMIAAELSARMSKAVHQHLTELLIASNPRYLEILGLPQELSRSGILPIISDVRGKFLATVDDYTLSQIREPDIAPVIHAATAANWEYGNLFLNRYRKL